MNGSIFEDSPKKKTGALTMSMNNVKKSFLNKR